MRLSLGDWGRRVERVPQGPAAERRLQEAVVERVPQGPAAEPAQRVLE